MCVKSNLYTPFIMISLSLFRIFLKTCRFFSSDPLTRFRSHHTLPAQPGPSSFTEQAFPSPHPSPPLQPQKSLCRHHSVRNLQFLWQSRQRSRGRRGPTGPWVNSQPQQRRCDSKEKEEKELNQWEEEATPIARGGPGLSTLFGHREMIQTARTRAGLRAISSEKSFRAATVVRIVHLAQHHRG